MKKDILDRYDKMVSTIEYADIYDGRGTYDLYKCEKCNKQKFTTYSVKGVTPFCIECSCGGTMNHDKTYKSVPDHIPVEKWVRPNKEQLKILSNYSIEHVLNGGLVLQSDLLVLEIKRISK